MAIGPTKNRLRTKGIHQSPGSAFACNQCSPRSVAKVLDKQCRQFSRLRSNEPHGQVFRASDDPCGVSTLRYPCQMHFHYGAWHPRSCISFLAFDLLAEVRTQLPSPRDCLAGSWKVRIIFLIQLLKHGLFRALNDGRKERLLACICVSDIGGASKHL